MPNGTNYSIYQISDGVLVEKNTAYDHAVGVIAGGVKIDLKTPPSTGDSIIIKPIKQGNMLNIIDNIAKKISDLYLDWKFEKNMIYDLSVDRYLAY